MRRSTFIFVFALFFGITQPASAQQCDGPNNTLKRDGECWNSLSTTLKHHVIFGIWAGKEIAKNDARFAGDGLSYLFAVEQSAAAQKTNVGDHMKYINKLYSFPINRNIKWKHAYLLSSINSRDDDSNDRIGLVRFLRDNNEIPTRGELVKIISPNEIRIKSGSQFYNVRLQGLEYDLNDKETYSKSMNILNLIKTAGWAKKSCKGTNDNARVSLSYLTEFFDESNKLVAHVHLMGTKFCVAGKLVKLETLWGNKYSKYSINYFLLRNGLAKFKQGNDILWSKSKNLVHNTLRYAAISAEKKNLYLHGGARSPEIEFVSDLLEKGERH